MNKSINIVLQFVLVGIFGGAALFMQNSEGSLLFSGSTVGVVASCAVLFWLVLNFFQSARFFLTLGLLLLGSVGGYLTLDLVAQPFVGYVVALFTVSLFLGAVMICGGGKLNLFFLKGLKMPLVAWVLVALLIDFALEMVFFEKELGLDLLQVKVIALLAGLVLGGIGKMLLAGDLKKSEAGITHYFLMERVGVSGGSEVEGVSDVEPVRAPKPKPVRTPRAKPVRKAPKPKKVAARKNPATPRVKKETDKPRVPVKSVVPEKSTVAKASILDAKLEALCSGGGAAGGKKKKKGAEGDQPAPASTPTPAVKETTETGKIVSSVDFG